MADDVYLCPHYILHLKIHQVLQKTFHSASNFLPYYLDISTDVSPFLKAGTQQYLQDLKCFAFRLVNGSDMALHLVSFELNANIMKFPVL